jgi:hypothetical protein
LDGAPPPPPPPLPPPPAPPSGRRGGMHRAPWNPRVVPAHLRAADATPAASTANTEAAAAIGGPIVAGSPPAFGLPGGAAFGPPAGGAGVAGVWVTEDELRRAGGRMPPPPPCAFAAPPAEDLAGVGRSGRAGGGRVRG